MVKRKDSVFQFLYYHDVPFDNNASERAVRNIKVKQKVSGSFRSERGAEIFSIIRSVIDTWIKRGVNIFDALICITQKNNQDQTNPVFILSE